MGINIFLKIISALRGSELRIFPLKDVLKDYTFAKAKADSRAAVNVALLDFPQAMAYALIAGLPVQLGIYCSALSSITGPILASSRFVMLGPTNATAVMLLSAFLTLGYDQAQAMATLPVLLLMVAGFMILGAFCKVASIVQYVSRSVVTGYITAAACLIIVNQLKTVCRARCGTRRHIFGIADHHHQVDPSQRVELDLSRWCNVGDLPAAQALRQSPADRRAHSRTDRRGHRVLTQALRYCSADARRCLVQLMATHITIRHPLRCAIVS